MGLLDSIPGMGFDASSTGTAGLLTPQDKLMALFSGLTNAGVMMAQPGLGKGQALAMGLGGLGQGIQKGNQMALQQQLMAGKLAEEQRKLAAQKVLDQAYGGNLATPGPSVASMSGMPVAEGMAARIGQSRDDALSKPEVQQALLSLYGPQGLAALQSAQKAPETVEGSHPVTGQPVRFMFNRQSGLYDIPVGGERKDATKPIYNQETKRWEYAPGVIDAEAGKKGAEVGAEEKARLPYVYPKAYNQAAGEAPFKTVPYTAGGGVVAPFAGSRGVMGALPGYGLPGTGAPGASASPAGSPPRLSQPPTVGGLPITGGNPPPPSDPRVVFKDQTVGQQPAEIEKYLAERFVETQKGAIDARNKNASLDRLGTLLDQAYTGTGADTVLAAQKAAKALGFDLGNPAPGEAGRALANEMSLQLRNPSGGAGMPGAMSDKDREFLQSMTPGLGMTPDGRAVLVDALRRVNKRNEDIGAFSRQYARDHGGRLDLNFEDEVSKRFSGTDMFGDLAKKMPTADPLTEARAAIAKGAPRDAVIDRLKRAGIDASGL